MTEEEIARFEFSTSWHSTRYEEVLRKYKELMSKCDYNIFKMSDLDLSRMESLQVETLSYLGNFTDEAKRYNDHMKNRTIIQKIKDLFIR